MTAANDVTEELTRQIREAATTIGPPSPTAKARKQRGTNLKKGISDSLTGRNGVNSQTVISFRGSEELKDRLAKQKDRCRAQQESLNEWLSRVIEDALAAEEARS